MCLINEIPPQTKECIGYALVEKHYDTNGAIYCSIFTYTPACTAGVRKEAAILTTVMPSNASPTYYGYHGFRTMTDAQLYFDLLALNSDIINLRIVEAKFEEIIADGEISTPVLIHSFRAKYRTILREITLAEESN